MKCHNPSVHSSLATARLTLTVRLCPPPLPYLSNPDRGVIDLTLPPLPEEEYPLPVRSICLNLFRKTLYRLPPLFAEDGRGLRTANISKWQPPKHGTDMQRICSNIIRNLNLVHIIRTYTEHYHYAQTK